eukprot:2227523-Rhodomonas_salina.2
MRALDHVEPLAHVVDLGPAHAVSTRTAMKIRLGRYHCTLRKHRQATVFPVPTALKRTLAWNHSPLSQYRAPRIACVRGQKARYLAPLHSPEPDQPLCNTLDVLGTKCTAQRFLALEFAVWASICTCSSHPEPHADSTSAAAAHADAHADVSAHFHAFESVPESDSVHWETPIPNASGEERERARERERAPLFFREEEDTHEC